MRQNQMFSGIFFSTFCCFSYSQNSVIDVSTDFQKPYRDLGAIFYQFFYQFYKITEEFLYIN